MSESPPAQQLLCPYCYKQLRGRTDYCSRCGLPIAPGDAHVTTSGQIPGAQPHPGRWWRRLRRLWRWW
ncbi:MAG: hypothetical protein OXU67_05310 [Chloroflexota bacterium]|nr:hypothetical protein [Chloroflexota bacterium]